MKVLVFSIAYEPHIGGAEVAIREVAARLPQHTFHIVTLRFDRSDLRFEEKGNVIIRRIGISWLPLFLRKVTYIPLAAFYAWRRRKTFDLIWSMMANYAGIAGIFLKIAYPRIPYVLTLQEGDEFDALLGNFYKVRWYRPLYNMIFTKADVIQCISNYLADFARTMAPKARIEVVPNGVDVERFSAPVAADRIRALRDELSMPEGAHVLLTASRLVDKNGIDYVIEAMPKMPNIIFVVAGVGEKEGVLRARAAELGVADRVRWIGFVPHAKLPEYLAASDCFIRLSRSEGMGNSFIEAMAARAPVVATGVGGIVDFLNDRNTGRIVSNPADTAEVAGAVMDCISNTELRSTILLKAFELVRDRYDWKTIAESMDTVLGSVVERRKQKRLLLCTGIYPPSIGGPATYAKLLADELPGQGIDVDVATFDHVRHLPRLIRHIAFFFKVLRRARHVDVVMVQDTVSVGAPAAFAAWVLRKPFVVRVPGDYAWEQGKQRFGVADGINAFQAKRYGFMTELLRFIQQSVVRGARVAIAPSDYFAGVVRGWTLRPERVMRIYNGVEKPMLPTREEARQSLGIAPDAFIVTTIGRLVEWKGFGTAIDAFQDAFTDKDSRLFVIGDGPQRSALERRAGDNVEITGSKSRDDVFKYLSASDVFLLNTSFESFSFQIVEAMMAGVPVISTTICNIPEIVTDGSTGVLVAPDDRLAIAAALRAYRGDLPLARRHGEQGMQRAELFSIQRTVEELARVIKGL